MIPRHSISAEPQSERRSSAALAFVNALTLGRMAVGLAFPWLAAGWRAPVVLVAAVSDLVDGEIGRRLAGSSTFGRLMDPIADKTLLLMVIGTLWTEGTISLLQIVLVGLREWVVLGLALAALIAGGWDGLRRMAPDLLGKIATGGQFVFLMSLLYWNRVVPALFLLAVVLSALAAANYLRKAAFSSAAAR